MNEKKENIYTLPDEDITWVNNELINRLKESLVVGSKYNGNLGTEKYTETSYLPQINPIKNAVLSYLVDRISNKGEVNIKLLSLQITTFSRPTESNDKSEPNLVISNRITTGKTAEISYLISQ